MPLITAIAVSFAGIYVAKGYENRKTRLSIREDLILDLTELERKLLYLGYEWNKWVVELLLSQELDAMTEETDLQRDRVNVAFIDFQVQLNKMYGKIQIYLDRQLITPKEYQKRIKKGEVIEIEPEIWAFGLSLRIATEIEKCLESDKLPKDPEILKNDFLDMNLALSSFYPDILTNKINL